jgi:hypothetical protein
MSNKARLSETSLNPRARGGIDLDAIAERVAERDQDFDTPELDFDAPPDTRKPKHAPKRVAQF